MKRLSGILIALVLLFTFAIAEDLSSMSFDDLIALQKKIAAEIMTRPEWKKVEVPVGVWRIGEDIPAGTYCIISNESSTLVQVWRNAINDYSDHGLIYNEVISSSSPYGKMILEDGWIFTANDPVIFSPPMSLGF